MVSYHIAAHQEKTKSNKGKVFYVGKRFQISVGETDDLIISSEPNGKGATEVDDSILVMIVDNNDPTSIVTYNHDYSNGCSGKVTPLPPVNLNQKDKAFNRFRGRKVSCTVKFADLCGGVQHATDIYLTVTAGK